MTALNNLDAFEESIQDYDFIYYPNATRIQLACVKQVSVPFRRRNGYLHAYGSGKGYNPNYPEGALIRGKEDKFLICAICYLKDLEALEPSYYKLRVTDLSGSIKVHDLHVTQSPAAKHLLTIAQRTKY